MASGLHGRNDAGIEGTVRSVDDINSGTKEDYFGYGKSTQQSRKINRTPMQCAVFYV